MNNDDLFSSRQIADFKRLVLTHVLALDENLWLKFREHDALMQDRWVVAEFTTTELSRAELVERYVASSNLPFREIQKVHGQWSSIGELAGQPVLFNSYAGIYAWSSAPDADQMLDLWLSYPAYPKGWG